MAALFFNLLTSPILVMNSAFAFSLIFFPTEFKISRDLSLIARGLIYGQKSYCLLISISFLVIPPIIWYKTLSIRA